MTSRVNDLTSKCIFQDFEKFGTNPRHFSPLQNYYINETSDVNIFFREENIYSIVHSPQDNRNSSERPAARNNFVR